MGCRALEVRGWPVRRKKRSRSQSWTRASLSAKVWLMWGSVTKAWPKVEEKAASSGSSRSRLATAARCSEAAVVLLVILVRVSRGGVRAGEWIPCKLLGGGEIELYDFCERGRRGKSRRQEEAAAGHPSAKGSR